MLNIDSTEARVLSKICFVYIVVGNLRRVWHFYYAMEFRKESQQ